MFRLAFVVTCSLACAASVARAETMQELEARGQKLAREGRYSEAIDAFKAADKVQPRAAHACLIALAYTRRELWPQAEVFLALCHARATADDPLPDWVPTADAQLAQQLALANVALVEITVTPADVPVRLTVSSFPSDEYLATRTVHLPFGKHELVAAADGYATARVPIEITDRERKQVAIELHALDATTPPPVAPVPPPAPPVAPVPLPAPRPAPQAAPSKVPWIVMGGGGAAVIAGAIVHLAVFEPTRTRLQNDSANHQGMAYASLSGTFDAERDAAIALYAAGAIAIATGIALQHTVYAEPTSGGMVVGVQWTR